MPVVRTVPPPPCRDCGEPAVVSYTKDGQTVHQCIECFAKPPSAHQQDTSLLVRLGLIKP
jgi:hypothetical protein